MPPVISLKAPKMNTETIQSQTPAQKFKALYMTASEVCDDVGVTRAALTKAILRGDLPDPIYVSSTFVVWEREIAAPFISIWKAKR